MRPAAHGTYGPGQIVAQGNPTQHPGALAGGAPTRAPLSDRAGAAVEDLLRLRCRLSDLVRQFELRLDGPTRDPEPSGGDTADVHIPDGLSERIDMIRHLADRLDQVVDHLNKHVLERLQRPGTPAVNSPTFGEARPVWRPSGDVETYVPQISAAERLARARQAGAPPPAPPLPLESTRRRGHGSAAPARREREEAESSSAAPSPRPAPPPAAEKPPEKPAGKPPAATQKRGNASTGTTQAILDVLADAGRPMWAKEVAAALEGHANVGVLMAGLRKRGALVQDVQPGPYRLPDAKPRQATVPAPEDTHANLARLVKQLRDERDTARAELAELRARWRVMAREMHLLAAPWGEEGR